MTQDRNRHQLSRRNLLQAGAGAAALTMLGAAPASPARAGQALATGGQVTTPLTAGTQGSVSIAVDPAARSSWDVARSTFGLFFEVIERKAYPGIIDQHLSNGSFEQWWIKGKNPPWYFKTDVLHTDIELQDGLAYPWEPMPAGAVGDTADGVEFEMPEGGVHGRRGESDGVPQRFQRVRVTDASGGVKQRLALPDERTLDYDLSLSVRGEGVSSLTVQMQDSAGSVVAEASLPLTGEWVRHEVRLRLAHQSPTRYLNDFRGHDLLTPFGEFAVVLSVTGTGQVDLDWAMLMAGDAVHGKFNPTTLEWFRDLGVGSLRWPGGNYTSTYHWEYGIGPWQDRVVARNQVWGGLDYNYLGIAEYLEFCELADIEPYVNLGYNTPSGRGEDITPEEAARCVEYCNGDISTPMGALRAKHGHPAPWNVKQWQLGNEVWGPLQNGHTDVAVYAEEFKAYYDAMKAADPSIMVYASGSDVWHLRLGDPPGTPPQWNKIFMDHAGDRYTDGLDIHNYVNGIKDGDRDAFLAEYDLDPVEYNQLLVGYPTGEDRAIQILREQARERGITDLKLTYGEFNANSQGGDGWPIVHWETVANAAFTAGMYNTFIRNGDVVRHSHQVDYTIYYRPSKDDWWPLSPAHQIRQMYIEPFRAPGITWHNAPVRISGPTFDIPDTRERMMPTPDVPVVDAACLVAGDGRTAYVFAVNRDLKQHHQVSLSVAGWPPGEASERGGPRVAARMLTSVPEDNPFAQERNFYERTTSKLVDFTIAPAADGNLVVDLPPAATVRLRLDATDR